MSSRSDVVVVGAGIVGLACAERLAAAGLRVTLVERARLGSGATGASGGLVRAFDLDSRVRSLAAESFASLARRGWRGTWPRVEKVGSLVLLPAHQAAAASQAVDELQKQGVQVDLLSAEGIRRRHRWAGRIPEGCIGVWEPQAGWVPAGDLARAIMVDAAGVDLQEGVAATRVLRRHGAVQGVATTSGDLHASAVVIAAGTASAGIAGVELPLRTRAISWACFQTPLDFTDVPSVVDHDRRVWLRPRGSGVLAGAVDDRLDVPAMVSTRLSDIEEHRIREALNPRYPDLAQPPLIEGVTAYDAISPERRGVVRLWDSPTGLITATGWNGAGLKQAPAIGARAAALVLVTLKESTTVPAGDISA